jgi:PAS domain S-box-containing protein
MDAPGFADVLLNLILDEIDDLIIIHDSSHNVVWMNRAALKAFGKTGDEVIGIKCYRLLGRSACCADCENICNQVPVRRKEPRVIPGTGEKYECTTVPYFEDGKAKLVIQHMRPFGKP